MNCCKNPEISTLSTRDYRIGDDGAYHERQITNKVCLRCNARQYGEGDGKLYTRKQWDAMINAAYNHENL